MKLVIPGLLTYVLFKAFFNPALNTSQPNIVNRNDQSYLQCASPVLPPPPQRENRGF